MLLHLRRVLDAARSRLKSLIVAAALAGWLTARQARASIAALGLIGA
jgi:hypothetical protein